MLRASMLVVAIAGSCSREGSREPSPTREELVVIDAGSSGTRARVFRLVPGQPDTLVGLGRACENDRPLALDIGGVLASHACAQQVLDDPRAPVLVFATGGMRTLAERDAARAERRHAEVVAALRERGVAQVESRTISGTDEALYEWLGVNHQEGRLDQPEPDTTLTIVEFGGASIQVAFELASDAAIDPACELAGDELREPTIAGVRRRVFVRSYLHCGMNEAREALAGPTCFASECASDPSCASSLPPDSGPPEGGDWASCRAGVGAALARETSSCAALQCLPPPLPARPIRLISRLADTFLTLGVVTDTHVDLDAAREATRRVCASRWTALQARGEPPTLCFTATYAALILEAWGVGAGDPRATITAIDHSWTWGVARERVERR